MYVSTIFSIKYSKILKLKCKVQIIITKYKKKISKIFQSRYLKFTFCKI